MLGNKSPTQPVAQGPPGEIVLSGTLDEYCKNQLAGQPVDGRLRIHCGGILRVNSAAIRVMIIHFRELRANGVRIHFIDMAPALVHAAALISGIIEPAEVESVLALYRCATCRKTFLERYAGTLLLETGFEFPPVGCRDCGKEAFFDELPESYSWIVTG